MLKLVSFDCWSTLICFDKESLVKMRHIRAKDFQAILSGYGYELEERNIQSVIKDSRKELDDVRSKTNKEFNTEQTIELILTNLKINSKGTIFGELKKKLAEVYSGSIESMDLTLQPGTIEILDSLKAKKIKIGLLSNTEHGDTEEKLLEKFDIAKYFDSIIFSCYFGVGKPAPEIFNKLLSELKVSPSEAVHIGDRMIDDVFGAKNAGMKAIYLKPSINYKGEKIVEPDATIENFFQLPSALDKLFES
ncbi:MAG: HAD family hydrolase [bacterium]|nr:HAD family hydrolase [bacterium]